MALVALALIWLPPLLRLLALTGGSLKAGGVEASAVGMFPRDELVELLTRAKAVTSMSGEADDGDVAIAELNAAVDKVAFDVLDSASSLDDNVLRRLALEYERLRRETPPGPARTSAMTRIVNEARVRAASSLQVAKTKAQRLLRSPSQGDRIVGLALAQEAVSEESFFDVMKLISKSETAFEMFHALIALQEMAPFLDESRRKRAVEELSLEQGDPRGVGIASDPGLPTLLQRTLLQLRSGGREG